MGMAKLIKKSHLNAEQQDVADTIGLENYQALVDTYGGDRLYIPKARSVIPVAELEQAIRDLRYRGTTDRQIAQELEIPVADVRKIK